MAAGGRQVAAGVGMLRQYTISTRWLQAHRRIVGSPMPDKAGLAGGTQSPGRVPLNCVKSAMTGVFGVFGGGLRLAACAAVIRMAHSAHAVASRRWRCDSRVGVMKIGPH
ncbi:hypothetical protein C5614_23535 [Massilia phosphatilytica]|nr:hypothetical protein C5614_23535 [Massilia phosphatilytica]